MLFHILPTHPRQPNPTQPTHQVVVEEVEVQKELFYTEGDSALVEARRAIAAWSLPRAAARLTAARQLRQGGLDVLKVGRGVW